MPLLPDIHSEWDTEDLEWRQSVLLRVGGNPKMAGWPLAIIIHQLNPASAAELIKIVRQRMSDSMVLGWQTSQGPSMPKSEVDKAKDLDNGELLWRRQNQGEDLGSD